MTPEQVTKRKSWVYALTGGGIACFIMAYQYAQPVVGRVELPPEFAPYLFGGIGIACLIIGVLLVIMAVCFVSASRIARNMRRDAAAGAEK
jgi:hypothetical protein